MIMRSEAPHEIVP